MMTHYQRGARTLRLRTDAAVLMAVAALSGSGTPPSLREIAAVARRSLWTVQKSRCRLIEAGYVRADPFASRTTVLTDKGKGVACRSANPAAHP